MIISPPSAVYGPTLAVRGLIVLLLSIPIAILAVVGWSETPAQVVPLIIAGALFVVMIALCVAAGKTQISLHQEGIRRTTAFGVKEIEWKDVREYRYRLVPMHHGGGLLGVAIQAAAARGASRGMNIYFQLIANDGTKIQVSSYIKNAQEAIGRILGQIHPPMMKKVNEELDRGVAAFGDLKLTRRNVQWKNKEPVDLTDITKAEIKATRLSIRKKGKMFDAISAPAHKVPNVLLFLEALDTLGVAKDDAPIIDPMARVR